MSKHLYAAFSDARLAESAAGALLDHGVAASDISLVVSEEFERRRNTPDDPELAYTQPTIVSGEAGSTNRVDPLGNDNRQSGTPPVQGGNLGPVGESAELDLNPAQNDYPRTGSALPTEFASRPPNSRYDFNAGLDRREYNADYEADVDRENRNEHARDTARTDPATLAKEGDQGPALNIPPDSADRQAPAAPAVPGAYEAGEGLGLPAYDPERAAKAGVTTTTIGDAAKGAAKGVGIGLGVGALAAVASIAIPGFGLVLGGGALATALAGLAASAGAGAVAGGVVGYLKDQGVSPDDIPGYQRAYEDGGAILSVAMDDVTVSRESVEALLRKYGAQNINGYGYVA